MAKYDYRCEECTELFEVDLPMGGEKPAVECPICGSCSTVKVYIAVPALRIDFGPNHVGDTGLPKFRRSTRSKRFVEES